MTEGKKPNSLQIMRTLLVSNNKDKVFAFLCSAKVSVLEITGHLITSVQHTLATQSALLYLSAS
jgi:hypothetical protein